MGSKTKKEADKQDKETQTEPPSTHVHNTTQNFYILPASYSVEEEAEEQGCGCDDDDDPEYFPEEEYEDSESEEDPKANLKRCYTREDTKYYDALSKKQKTRIDRTEEKIKELDFFQTPMRFRILESNSDPRIKQLAIQKIDELSMMFPGSGEYFKLKNWVEGVCKLPVGKYKSLPVTKYDPIEKISGFMDRTKKRFDELVYGHVEAKQQIHKLLAKWISNPSSHGIVIGINGPAGCGKTTLCMALCEVLGLPFGFVSLAGINGEPFFTGFSYCYEGSRCGRIADILTSAQCMNPILYFDELDKVSTTSHGEEISNFLVHLTDFSQNHKFQDKYFGDIDMDLSKCIIIFSYNHEELINPILKDRMITIRTKGYDLEDKVALARDYMLPKVFKEFGFENGDLVFSDDTIRYIVEKIDEEKGARNMNRAFEEIVGTINFKRLLGEEKDFPMVITTKIVDKYIVITKKVKDNTSANMMYL